MRHDPGLAAHLQEYPDPSAGRDPLDGLLADDGGSADPLDGLIAESPPKPGLMERLKMTREQLKTPEGRRAVVGSTNPSDILRDNPLIADTITNVVPAIAGSVAGGAIAGAARGAPAGPYGVALGGGLGALAGYLGTEYGRGRPIHPRTAAIQAVTGAIPALKATKTLGGAIVKNALAGGVIGTTAGTGQKLFEQGQWPTLEELVTMGGTGALFGGTVGGAGHKLFGPRPAVPPPPPQKKPLLALPPTQALPVTPEGRVVVPRTVGAIPPEEGAPRTPPIRQPSVFSTLRSQDYPPPPPVEQPPGMNVLEAVDRWNPRAVDMRAALEEAEQVRQSPQSLRGSIDDLGSQERVGLFGLLRGEDYPAPPPVQPEAPTYPLATSPADIAGMKAAAHGGPAIEAEMVAAERLRQSAAGRDALRRQLAQATAKQETPSTGVPSGTTELGMGLQVPEKVKEWLKRFGGRVPVSAGRNIPPPVSQSAPAPSPLSPLLSEGQRIRAERRAQRQPLIPPSAPPSAGVLPPTAAPLSPFQQAQQRLLDAIKAAKPIRAETERLYSEERGKRLGAALGVGQSVPGREGYYAQLGKLQGDLPKGTFEPLSLDPEAIKTLFTGLRESRAIAGWEQITAQRGLEKLLGGHGGVVPTRGELDLLGRVFPPEFVKEVLAKRGLIPRLLDMTAEALAIPKSLRATGDLSASLRQGMTAVTSFPRQWGSAFKEQFRYFGSERAYEKMILDLEAHPNFEKMRQSKLALSAVDGSTLTGREEQFMSTLPERIPGVGRFVRASDRAYTGFLTKLRADAFEEMLRRAKQAGIPETEKMLTDTARFVNTFTGRGGLGKLEAAGSALSTAFFSPRLMASRFQMLNPGYYASLDPFVRKEALKAALGTVALGTTVLALAKAGGAQVGIDPRNADFGKIRVRNTRWDVWAGLSHFPRIAAQLISGKVVSSVTGKTLTLGEGHKPLTRKDIIQRFFENKANPAVGFALRMLEGRGFEGKPIKISSEVAELFIPLIFEDMHDLYNEDPTLLPWATPSIFGVGVQTYGQKKPR